MVVNLHREKFIYMCRCVVLVFNLKRLYNLYKRNTYNTDNALEVVVVDVFVLVVVVDTVVLVVVVDAVVLVIMVVDAVVLVIMIDDVVAVVVVVVGKHVVTSGTATVVVAVQVSLSIS